MTHKGIILRQGGPTVTVNKDFKSALLIYWMIATLAIMLVLAVPFIFPLETVSGLLPNCTWRAQHGKGCIFCGMTGSFYHLTGGEYREAIRINSLSIWLFHLFLLNQLAFAVFSIRYVYLSIHNKFEGRQPLCK